MSYLDVNPSDLIKEVAKKLKEQDAITPPQWAAFVKTGVHKERPPIQEDWWYLRSAAVLRTVANLGPIGTNKLRVKYGGKKRRGHKPSRFKLGSGNILRKVLQQLEAAKLIRQTQIQNRKGRIITAQGIQLLDKTAHTVKENGNK